MGFTTLIAQLISNYENPNSIGSKLRIKRIGALESMINHAYDNYGHVNIIDVGGTYQYWKILPEQFLREKQVKITIVNLAGAFKHTQANRFFSFLEGNGCDLSAFENKSFHIAHSNSVIEHVGSWNEMTCFAQEITRVSKSYFVQTPYFWFPIEPHYMLPFFHWLPEPARVSIVMKFDLARRKRKKDVDSAVRSLEHVRLLDKRMFSTLFKDAHITYEKVLYLPKSIIAIKHDANGNFKHNP